MQHKIVITGGPGSGKTTLIKELTSRNYICIPEISRQVTQEAREKGIEYLFLEDPLLFSKLLLEGREKQYIDALNLDTKLIFFDRGIPDVHAYMNYNGTVYSEIYLDKSKNYTYDSIFLLPPWKEIYITDDERYESYDSAVALHSHLKQAYTALGYSINEVPTGKVAYRVDYILNQLKHL